MGACVVSSVAVGDFTSASDVDMIMVDASGEGKPGVHRKLLDGRVFEWVVVGEAYVTDVDAILAHAGLTHDMLAAVILLDKTGRLEEVKREVQLRYRSPEGIWKRTTGQLHRIRDAIDRMQRQLEQQEILSAQRSHVSALKGIFGLPRALLNKRCTMTRAPLFCREATAELGWSEYITDALEIFGAARAHAQAVRGMRALALEIVAATGFCDSEKAIRIRHLEGSQWLLANAHPADAAWPLYFWSSKNVAEAGGNENEAVWGKWRELAAMLGVQQEHELWEKQELSQHFLDSAIELADAYRPMLGL